MNENFYYLTLVFCISFTVINTDLEASKKIGYIVIGFIIAMVGSNITIISFTTSTVTYKYIKKQLYQKKKQKIILRLAERQKEKQKLKAIL
jgi:hypothetical protein